MKTPLLLFSILLFAQRKTIMKILLNCVIINFEKLHFCMKQGVHWRGLLFSLFFLLSLSSFAQFAPRTQVENCINLSAGKLVVPPEAVVNVTHGCLNEAACVQLPVNFSCITFGFMPHTQVTTCTDVPENGSPTEPVIPQCSSVMCSQGTRTETATTVTCSWTVLEIDPAKKAAYDDQKASAEQAQSLYQESQIYNNLQDFCLYAYQTSCVSLPSSTKTKVSRQLSGHLGLTERKIKRLLNKKR